MNAGDHVAKALAVVTDRLAWIGERLPGVSSITISAAGASITVVPKPASPPLPPAPCPTCGRPSSAP